MNGRRWALAGAVLASVLLALGLTGSIGAQRDGRR